MNPYQKIVRLKERDTALQLLSLPVMVFLFFNACHLFSLYLVAAVQCVSCLFWRSYFRKAGDTLLQTRAGIRIRKIFLIVMIIHGAFLVLLPLFLFLAIAMVFAGPFLGVAYFYISVKETKYYNNLQPPPHTPVVAGYGKTGPDDTATGSCPQ